MKASISKAAAFMRQRLHPLAKVMVIAAPGFVTDRHPAKADGFTRPPFAHLVAIHQMNDSFPPCLGVTTSFPRVFQSRIVEHRIRQEPLQLRVLVFQRLQPLASDTSMPPNLAFHL